MPAENSYPKSKSSTHLIEKYLKDIRRIPLLDKEQEQQLAHAIAKGDLKAKEVLISSNLRLVVKIAKRYLRSGIDLLDLIEEGNLGLMRAVEKFNPDYGFRFSTYGACWIQQNIERAIMNQARLVRLPVHISKRVNRYLKQEKKGVDQLERNYMQEMLLFNENPISIERPLHENTQKPFAELLGEASELETENQIQEDQVMKILEKLLDSLGKKHQAVLIKRFGLLGNDSQTLDQTGVDIGLTRERVRRAQTDALQNLKYLIQEKHLHPILQDYIRGH